MDPLKSVRRVKRVKIAFEPLENAQANYEPFKFNNRKSNRLYLMKHLDDSADVAASKRKANNTEK